MENLEKKLRFSLVSSNKKTKHRNYIILVNGKPAIFVKNNPELSKKESEVTKFFIESGLLPALPILFEEGDIMLIPYVYLRDVEFENIAPAIADFHKRSLRYRDFSRFEQKPEYVNMNRERCLIRVRKHMEIVALMANPDKVINYLKQKLCLKSNQPKILVHGDIQRGNVKQDRSGNFVFLDFEIAYLDYPSWDLSRPITDVPLEKVPNFVESYVREFNYLQQDSLREQIYGDAVCRMINDGIAWHQHPEFNEKVQKHLDLYKKYLEVLLDGY